ncbi:uncharacterized protein BO97DRAFT_429877 [Aspergillus homomorphus CBS 101889]|uniref:Uncharacterized protein n=1 Tax=Aspergillus homomorphus (strain CBS 101889) TaxID=1450537 RepID=A0A395HH77_ASPHC|nr:hypothetical protein BO97DRAFT_429877 [Aspergillus homomorphus CBS 101889]RAL06849.1 hypothetical protein BO97DRAFT_429877 [Aspergillus homomorphus CBS 101889]
MARKSDPSLDELVYVWGPYNGWLRPSWKPEEEQEESRSEAVPAGNLEPLKPCWVGLYAVEQIAPVTQLLAQQGIASHVMGDCMWRLLGCTTHSIRTIDLVIARGQHAAAVKALKEYGRRDSQLQRLPRRWQDRCPQYVKSEAWGCEYLATLRTRDESPVDYLPAHVFHMVYEVRRSEYHTPHEDLRIFHHEDLFPTLPLPALTQDLNSHDPNYLWSSDRRLTVRHSHLACDFPMLRPARLVEALTAQCFRDVYLQVGLDGWHYQKAGRCRWVATLRAIFRAIAAADGVEVEEAQGEKKKGKEKQEMEAEGAENWEDLHLNGLDPRWFRLENFDPLFQEYIKDLLLTQSLPSPPSAAVSRARLPIRHCFKASQAFLVLNTFAWRLKDAGFFPPRPLKKVLALREAVKLSDHPILGEYFPAPHTPEEEEERLVKCMWRKGIRADPWSPFSSAPPPTIRSCARNTEE